MDIPEQSSDPGLEKFDKWLITSKIEPPKDLLANVRASLRDPASQLDRKIDELFALDPSLKDPQLLWKIRGRLTDEDSRPVQPWYRWLAPVAACATLVLTLISFQSEGPGTVRPGMEQQSLALNDSPVLKLDLDEETTRILALAANLGGNTDLSELESVENLSFLFE